MLDIDSLLSFSPPPPHAQDNSLSPTTLSPSPSHKSSFYLNRAKQLMNFDLEEEEVEGVKREEEREEESWEDGCFSTKSGSLLWSRKTSQNSEEECLAIMEKNEVEMYIPLESRAILPFEFWFEKEAGGIQMRYRRRKRMEKEVTIMRLIAQKQENFLESYRKTSYYKREEDGVKKSIRKVGGRRRKEEEDREEEEEC